MQRYEGRRVLVTGAGSGIGQATVARVLAEGAHVVAADTSEIGLAATADAAEHAKTDDRLTTQVIDISDEQSVRTGVAAAIHTLGGLDVLVNAAGILRSSHTAETSLAEFMAVLNVNLAGTFLMIRESIPVLLRGHEPVIVNFSSTSASFAHPYMSAYAASKGGIQAMTHALAAEYSKQGLRVVAAAPGSISSGMTDASGSSDANSGPGLPDDLDPSLLAKLSPAIGEGFAGPETAASIVAMLGSSDAAFVTGTEIRIDGGTHA